LEVNGLHGSTDQEWNPHRGRGRRVALAIVLLAACAVPAYIAYEDPSPFRQAINLVTPDPTNEKETDTGSGRAPTSEAPPVTPAEEAQPIAAAVTPPAEAAAEPAAEAPRPEVKSSQAKRPRASTSKERSAKQRRQATTK
jgi:hypothetical protein